MNEFDISAFILQLLVSGGIAMTVSGWIAAKWTHLTGTAMLIQSLVVAIALAGLASLVGIIPVPIAAFWTWIKLGLGNGVLAALIYKIGIFNNLLTSLGARTAHQLLPKT